MAIDPTGGDRDSGLAARRRMIEVQREAELARVENSFHEQIKQQEQTRGEALRKARENQGEELARVQNDVAHKVTLATQAADQQLRNVQTESLNLTQDASRKFKEKAQVLTKAHQELDAQRNHLIATHSDSLKKMNEDNDFMRTEMRNRQMAEAGKANEQGEMYLQSVNKKQQSELNRLADEFSHEKRKAEAQGSMEYARLKDQQSRLQEELRQEDQQIKGRGQAQMDAQRKNLAQRYEAERIKADGNIENLRHQNQKAMMSLRERGMRTLTDLRETSDHEIHQTQKESAKKLATTRDMTATSMELMERDHASRKKMLEADFHKKVSDLRTLQDAEGKNMEERTTGMRQKANEQYLAQTKEISEKRVATIAGLEAALHKDVNRIIDQGAKQIEASKQQTTETVSGNLAKSQDPFYRLRQLGLSTVEREDGLMILMESPEHEKDSVRVTNNAKGITVTGNRRHEARNEIQPGHVVTTNSYQSYSETIDMPYKVDVARSARTYENGVLKIFLPRS